MTISCCRAWKWDEWSSRNSRWRWQKTEILLLYYSQLFHLHLVHDFVYECACVRYSVVFIVVVVVVEVVKIHFSSALERAHASADCTTATVPMARLCVCVCLSLCLCTIPQTNTSSFQCSQSNKPTKIADASTDGAPTSRSSTNILSITWTTTTHRRKETETEKSHPTSLVWFVRCILIGGRCHHWHGTKSCVKNMFEILIEIE